MMESMRNAAKGWAAKVLIGLLAISFGVWGIADVFTGSRTGALATVGKQEIAPEQFNIAFRDYLQNYARQTGRGITPEEARALGIDRAILDNLLQQAALDHQANKLNLGVSDTYLAHEVMVNPGFQDAAGKFDAQRFKVILDQNGLSEQAFFAEERQRLLRQALTETASTDITVNLGLLEAQHRFDNEQRDARYFIVTTQDSETAAPTDDEIKKEYEANPAAYTAPEYRAIATMKVEPGDIASRVTLTDEDIAAGFEKYKGDYFTPETRTILQISFPTLEEAEAARQKLAAGTDFMALATERGFSAQDVTFADKAKTDFIDQAIAGAAFSLAQGQVSEPVKGTLATVLLKAEKITPEKQSNLEDVKDELAARLKLERASEEIQAIYDAVEDARAAQTPFEEIAASAGIPFQLLPAVDAQGNGKDGKPVPAPNAGELINAAFTSDVGVENDAISLDNGYVWYEVREVTPSALRPFEEVKDQARNAVVAGKLRTLAEEKAKKLVERAKSGANFAELAAETGAELKTAQGLRRAERSDSFGPGALAALFSVPDNGVSFALEPDGRSARVMQSQPVMLPAFVAASAEAKQISDRLKGQLADNVLTAYLEALEQQAGVSVNEATWRNISGQQTN
jgi:peptidyl-prolyl cis-trans isomerase D